MKKSKSCEFHLLTLKEPSNVFRSVQRRGIRRNEVIYHAEAQYPEKNFRADVSTAAKVAGFPCSKRTPNVH